MSLEPSSRRRPRGRPGRRRAPPGHHHPQLARPRGRVGAGRVRQDPGALRRVGLRGRAALAQGLGPGLGDRGVRHAPRRPPTPAPTASRSRAASAAAPTRSRRLIGRSLRAVIDYKALGENTIVLDCDVLQADGGTRTAAITGAYVALADAVAHLRVSGALTGEPLTGSVAAVSVGIIDGAPRLDLHYDEDVRAETDMNVVMTGDGKFVEVQGTAEGAAFDRAELDALLALAEKGCADLTRLQQEALAPVSAVFLASRNAKKLAEMQRILASTARASRCSGSTTWRRTTSRSRTSRRSRATRCSRRAPGSPPPGCRRSPTTAASASTRSTACPGVLSARWSGPPKSDDAQQRAAARPARRRARRAPRRPLRLRRRVLPPRRHRGGRPRARCPAGSSASCGAAAASATTCCSWPTTSAGVHDLGRADARGQGRDLPPRQGAARDRARSSPTLLRLRAHTCRRRDSNPHARRHRYLKPACLPVPPLRRACATES